MKVYDVDDLFEKTEDEFVQFFRDYQAGKLPQVEEPLHGTYLHLASDEKELRRYYQSSKDAEERRLEKFPVLDVEKYRK